MFSMGCGALSACLVGSGGACQATQPGPLPPSFPPSLDTMQPWPCIELNDEEQRFWSQMVTEALLCRILAE